MQAINQKVQKKEIFPSLIEHHHNIIYNNNNNNNNQQQPTTINQLLSHFPHLFKNFKLQTANMQFQFTAIFLTALFSATYASLSLFYYLPS